MKGLVGANARAADLMRFLLFVSVGFVVGTEGTHAYAQGDNDMLDTAWVRTGGPLGGLGYDIRFRPDNTDWMYVTDNFAGVFRSYDGGQTWEPSNAGITTRTGPSNDAIPIFSLTVDPNDYDIIWAGVNGQRGIYRSTDGGAMWVQMNNGVVEESGIAFRGFTIEPGNSDVVYAAAEIPSFVWSTEEVQGREFDLTRGVVYRTVDGGENWAEIWRGDSLARYIWIDPRNHDVLYISTGIFDREAANSDPDAPMTPAAAGGVGVVRSTDGGVTWTEVNNGLENLYVGSLFMHPDDPDILLAGTGNNQYADANGAYLSTDGGLSWQQTLDGDKINSVEFAGSDPDIAYAGSANAIYRSENGGLSWTVVSGGDASGWGPPGVRAGFPIDFQVDPDDPNRIFVNNYGGGNFLSEDGGATWAIATQGYTGAQVRDVAVDPTASGRIYAAGRSGLFVSHDGGEQWAGRSYSPAAVMEWYAVAVDPDNPQHVLGASNWDGILCESHDGGASWEIVHNATEGQSWRSIVFDPSDPSTVYTGLSAYFSAGVFDDMMDAGGIYVSHDGGTTWIESNDSVSQNANVTALAVDPENSQVVYAATGNRGILRSIDGGSSWNEINQGLPSTPTALAVVPHPDNAEIVFVGLHSAGIYRSGNAGANWEPAMIGMGPEATVSDIVFDPTDDQTMYAADRIRGVYLSEDGGDRWTQITDGLRTRDVNSLAISSDGQHLYAGTEGEGVFRLDISGEEPPDAEEPSTDNGDEDVIGDAVVGDAEPDIHEGEEEPTEQACNGCNSTGFGFILLTVGCFCFITAHRTQKRE